MKSIAIVAGIVLGAAGGLAATWQSAGPDVRAAGPQKQAVQARAVAGPIPAPSEPAAPPAIAPQASWDILRIPANAADVRCIWFIAPNKPEKLVFLPITQAQSDAAPGYCSNEWIETASGWACKTYWCTTEEGYDAVP